MGNKLSLKQQTVLMELPSLGNDWRKAIMKVYGYTKETKGVNQKVYSVKKNIQKNAQFREFLEVNGIDANRFAAKLNELLDARITKSVGGELYEEPHFPTQLGALSLLADVMGVKQKNKSREIGTQNNSLIIVSSSKEEALKEVREIRERYGQELTDPNYQTDDEDDA